MNKVFPEIEIGLQIHTSFYSNAARWPQTKAGNESDDVLIEITWNPLAFSERQKPNN